jgi:ABC-type nitrate/sulfonate/bicarbonate transport system substrate-binding protein
MNKPRHKQQRCSFLLVSAAILTLAVCYSSTVFSADKQDKIRVAYSSISGNTASLWVAYEHGFFRKHGLTPKEPRVRRRTGIWQSKSVGPA